MNLADGTARRIVKPGQVFNRIHVDDIAAALLASLEQPRAGAVYNVADDEPAPPQDVVAYAAALLGVAAAARDPLRGGEPEPDGGELLRREQARLEPAHQARSSASRCAIPTYREGLARAARGGRGAAGQAA